MLLHGSRSSKYEQGRALVGSLLVDNHFSSYEQTSRVRFLVNKRKKDEMLCLLQ